MKLYPVVMYNLGMCLGAGRIFRWTIPMLDASSGYPGRARSDAEHETLAREPEPADLCRDILRGAPVHRQHARREHEGFRAPRARGLMDDWDEE